MQPSFCYSTLELSALFLFIIELSEFMVLVFCYNFTLENKAMMQKNLAIIRFLFVTGENSVNCSACVESTWCAKCGIAILAIRLFLENHSLEFHEVWYINTLEIK